MTVAMMLPGSLPMVNLFRRVTLAQADRALLLAGLLGAYLAIWALFGVVAYLGDAALHAALAEAPAWLAALVAPAVALAAGVYQFTPLKHACLEACRSPFGLLVGHWSGRSPR
jgi:predicted metal-binding membrane protein